jgi:GNAT superfamily N-acetyltransferase
MILEEYTMQLINGNLKLSLSTEKELEKLNEIYVEESKLFSKLDPEQMPPNPYICFSEGVFPPGKSKEDFKMLSCYVDDTLIGNVTILKGYPEDDIYYIGIIYLVNTIKHKGYGKRIINLLCDYFRENKMTRARICVALKNWDGIRFWYKCGFDKITSASYDVSYSEETFASIELEKTL